MSDSNARLSLFPASAPSLLAQGASSEAPETKVRDFLAFALAESLYAVALGAIQKVIKLTSVTEVPLAPEPILGIISVRGRVTTLFDARRLLGLPRAQPTVSSRVLLMNRGEEPVGLLVDGVVRVYRLDDSEIEPPEAAGAERQPHVIGIGRPEREDVESWQAADEVGSQSLFFEPFTSEAGRRGGEEVIILLDPAVLLKGRGRDA